MNYTHTDPMGGQRPSIFRRFAGCLLLMLSMAALATTASAQNATITGRVINQGTGEYLKYAQVQIVGTDKSAVSEEGGYFTIANAPAGEVKLLVTYTGLDNKEVTLTVPAEGPVSQDISLSSSDYGDTIKLGEFKVSSAREGNAKAIVDQRQALNLKTVISADAFGDVSEGNVGEFLRLLPGVTVDYVDNDVRTTRIRGLPGKYATTSMDGHMIATAGSASINTGRQFELEQVSLTSLDTVETAKSPTPDMMSPGLAGNTNILNKSAFNQKGRSIKYSGSVGMSTKDLTLKKSDGWDNTDHYKVFPSANAEWVDTFLEGKLGLVLSAGHSTSYNEQTAITTSETFDRNASNNGSETPLLTQIQLQDGPKVTNRESLLLNLEYKVSDDLKLSLRTSYGNYSAEFYNRNWTINASTTSQVSSTSTTNGAWGSEDGTLVTSFYRTGVSNSQQSGSYISTTSTATTQTNASITGSNFRKSGGTFVVSPAMTWKFNDFKIDAATSYSRATSQYRSGSDGYFAYIQASMTNVSWKYAKTGERSYHIQQTTDGTGANTASILDLSSYTNGGVAINEHRDGEDRIWTANLDATWDKSDWSIPTIFKVGGNTSLNVLDINTFQEKWTISLTSGASTASSINLGDYADPYNTDTAGGVEIRDLNGRVGYMPSADKWKLYSLFAAGGNSDPFSEKANGAFTAQISNNLRNMLQNQYDIKEKIHTGYAMATVKPMKKLAIVAGLRFEKTETAGRSYDDKGANATLSALGYTGFSTWTSTARAAVGTGAQGYEKMLQYIYYRYGTRTTHTNDYTNTLPSIQGKYEIQKNLLVRAAYYKSLLRPDFQNAVGGVVASENSSNVNRYSFTVKNTSLKPETADNFDASIEYYMEPVGLISLAGFYKNVKDIQVSTSETVDLNNLPEEITDLGFNSTNLDANSTITTYMNGPKTYIWGAELSYQQELTFLPGALKGLGVTANYTYIEPEDKRIWALVANAGDGLSQNAANFIVRYKYQKFNAQVTTSWADKKINGISGVTLKADGTIVPTTSTNANTYTWIRDRWQVNVNLNYKLNRRATLFLNVSNLFNEPQYRYVEQSEYITRHGNYGTQFTMGVKGQF